MHQRIHGTDDGPVKAGLAENLGHLHLQVYEAGAAGETGQGTHV